MRWQDLPLPPSQTPIHPLRDVPPIHCSRMSQKSFWSAPPSLSAQWQHGRSQCRAADWSLPWAGDFIHLSVFLLSTCSRDGWKFWVWFNHVHPHFIPAGCISELPLISIFSLWVTKIKTERMSESDSFYQTVKSAELRQIIKTTSGHSAHYSPASKSCLSIQICFSLFFWWG